MSADDNQQTKGFRLIGSDSISHLSPGRGMSTTLNEKKIICAIGISILKRMEKMRTMFDGKNNEGAIGFSAYYVCIHFYEKKCTRYSTKKLLNAPGGFDNKV